MRDKLLSDDARRLLDETQSVKYIPGDSDDESLTVHLELERDDVEESRTLEFSSREWVQNSATTLRTRYLDTFLEKANVSDEDWSRLTARWDDQADVVDR